MSEHDEGAASGWRMVPVEPTPEMIEAGWPIRSARTAWERMIAAAPPPPETAGLVDALEYLAPHERTADASAVALTAGKMRTAIGVIRAALARTVELRAVSNSARTV